MPLSYQWYLDGAPVGDNSDTLTGTAGSAASVENVYCDVTNEAGTTESNTVTLTVVDLPVITLQPVDQTANEGETATFTSDGTGQDSIQWQFSDNGTDWSNASGGTTKDFTTNALDVSKDGREFRVRYTNIAGTTTSNIATLTVNPATDILGLFDASVLFEAQVGTSSDVIGVVN